MVQFLSIFFFLGFLQFLLGFSKVSVFLCHSVYYLFYSFGIYVLRISTNPRVGEVQSSFTLAILKYGRLTQFV